MSGSQAKGETSEAAAAPRQAPTVMQRVMDLNAATHSLPPHGGHATQEATTRNMPVVNLEGVGGFTTRLRVACPSGITWRRTRATST